MVGETKRLTASDLLDPDVEVAGLRPIGRVREQPAVLRNRGEARHVGVERHPGDGNPGGRPWTMRDRPYERRGEDGEAGHRRDPPAPSRSARGGGRDRAQFPGIGVLLQVLQHDPKVRHALPPPLRVLAEAAFEHAFQLGRQIGDEPPRRLGLLGNDGRERARRRVALERATAGHHLVQDGAKREDVRSAVDLLSLRLLRRHVGRRTDDVTVVGEPVESLARRDGRRQRVHGLPLEELRQAEVENLHGPVARDHDVRRFEIPMDDARRVRLGQPVGDLHRVAEGLAEPEPFAADQAVERAARHVLHHDDIPIALACDVVDGDDVRVLEGGGGLGFLLEAPAALRIGDAVGREELERDVAIEARVVGLEDNAHPAPTELVEDRETSQRLAEHNRRPYVSVPGALRRARLPCRVRGALAQTIGGLPASRQYTVRWPIPPLGT